MIINFKHPVLATLLPYSSATFPTMYIGKIARLLAWLNAATTEQDLNLPGLHFREGWGDRKGIFEVRIAEDWWLSFRFVDHAAQDVNLEHHEGEQVGEAIPPPTHPGIFLKEDILPFQTLTQGELAQDLGTSRFLLSGLLHGTRRITAVTAVRLAKLFNTTPEVWLTAQSTLSVWQAVGKGRKV